MKRSVLDTNVLIDWLNRGLREELVVGPGRFRFLSTVVVMELRAGAGTPAARKAVDRLERSHASAGRLLAPTAAVFSDAGGALRRLQSDGRDIRRASLVNDVLIALTARACGACVVTRDASDYEAIAKIRAFALEIVG